MMGESMSKSSWDDFDAMFEEGEPQQEEVKVAPEPEVKEEGRTETAEGYGGIKLAPTMPNLGDLLPKKEADKVAEQVHALHAEIEVYKKKIKSLKESQKRAERRLADIALEALKCAKSGAWGPSITGYPTVGTSTYCPYTNTVSFSTSGTAVADIEGAKTVTTTNKVRPKIDSTTLKEEMGLAGSEPVKLTPDWSVIAGMPVSSATVDALEKAYRGKIKTTSVKVEDE